MSDQGYLNYFEILELDDTARPGDVRKVYKQKMKDLVFEIMKAEITEDRRARFLLEMAKLNAAFCVLRSQDTRDAYWADREELIRLESEWAQAVSTRADSADNLRRQYDSRLRDFLATWVEEKMLEAGRDKECVEASNWDAAHERHAYRILRHFRQRQYREILERLPYSEITQPSVDWEERARMAARLVSVSVGEPSGADEDAPRLSGAVNTKKKGATQEKVVDYETIARALAKAVATGDIVNFRLLLLPLSPARVDSTEYFDTPKYAYLSPGSDLERTPEYGAALELAKSPKIRKHVEAELAAKRPAQLPSDLLVPLADNAVRREKYGYAAQAYELLRIRARMQDEFLRQADLKIDEGDIVDGVRGYRIAVGLAYNYSAFPEPLPLIPDHQTTALMLHAEYPSSPDNCMAMKPTDAFLSAALGYLLGDVEIAARLDARDLDVRLAFFRELVERSDSRWNEFQARYHEATALTADLRNKVMEAAAANVLEDDLEQFVGDLPLRIPAMLLGREIPDGEWWQYLKELAYQHPAAVLFLARQVVGRGEVLIPRWREDVPVAPLMGLVKAGL